MPAKHNQYRNRITRTYGSTGQDTGDKNKVKRILEKMGVTDIHFDMFLGITHENHYRFYSSMTKAQTMQFRKIRHPDVSCIMSDGRPLIIEIDGGYHGDFDYDRDYEEIDILYVKLNKEYLKNENIAWADWIKYTLDPDSVIV